MRMLPTKSVGTVVAAVMAVVLTACADPVSPSASALKVPAVHDATIIEVEVPLADAEVDEADDNKSGKVCVKPTPSGHVLYRDENLNTPSQPCPPSFEYSGKGQAVKIPAEVWDEDENKNGVVCWKEVKTGRYIIKDDSEGTPSQPCPPAYYATSNKKAPHVKIEDLREADDNRNGMVCLKIFDLTSHFIVKDDNLATPSQLCPPSYTLEQPGRGDVEPPKG